MKAPRLRIKNVVSLLLPLAIVACAQLQGLDDYEKVDCVGEACGPGTTPQGVDASTGGNDASQQPDTTAPATCEPCTDGKVCDQKSLKCVECLPGTKPCAAGQFCDPDETLGFKCVQGCGTVQDCLVALGADAGPDAEAGIFDAGGDGGAGTLACCNNRCVDTASDGKNCGACNTICGASAACCDSNCQDIVSTPTSCGGCGVTCSGNHVPAISCGAKACNGACEGGWADCNMNKLTDGCETSVSGDPDKCGGCNTVCSNNHMQTRTCGASLCNGTCAPGFLDCNTNKQTDGCEINIGTDAANCGDCNKSCSNNNITTPTCGGGVCNGACNAGYSDCNTNKQVDGCETKTSGVGADPNNCGGCGSSFTCSNNNMATRTCNGACNGNCATGFADCFNGKLTDGCETNIYTNVAHCGGCNVACSSNHVPTPACSGTGQCTGACETNWGDCNNNRQTDGCETRTDNDTLHCGACNAPCNTVGQRRCSAGTCSAGYGATPSPQVFIDACTQAGATNLVLTPTNMTDTADDEGITASLNLPFTFTFAGVARTTYWVWSNGAIGFGTPTDPGTFGDYDTCPGPDSAYTQPMIYPFLADLKGKTNFQLCSATVGAVGTRKHIVTWKNTAFYPDPTTATITFSAILNEGTNTIDVAIQTLQAPAGESMGETAVIGIQTNTTTLTSNSCRDGTISAGTQVRFIP